MEVEYGYATNINALTLLAAGVLALSACGGGGGGCDSGGVTPSEIQTEWNEMNWDEGRWN